MKFDENSSNTNDYESRPLSNSDFRKLLDTPRHVSKSDHSHDDKPPKSEEKKSKSDSKSHKKKHKHYHKSHQSSNAEPPSARYRDRAKERRDGKIVENKEEQEPDVEKDEEKFGRTADYRAVGPIAAGPNAAERRQVLIQESKYLGGDMEHTHLVKGLDYVLLQKVKQEIKNKEKEADTMLDLELSKPEETTLSTPTPKTISKNPMTSSILNILNKNKPVEKNEYFVPGRMAYRVELDDDTAETEIPVQLIRSKMDLPNYGSSYSSSESETTNEIVIAKLTQILSYLREGKRQNKKIKVKAKPVDVEINSNSVPKSEDQYMSIYNDIPDVYIPTIKGNKKESKHEIPSNKDDARSKATEKSSRRQDKSSRDYDRNKSDNPKYFDRSPKREEASLKKRLTSAQVIEKEDEKSKAFVAPQPKEPKTGDKTNLDRLLKRTQVSGYEECYPGVAESYDAMGDSDDETDYLKMDSGNKRGPVGRWDFDTNEEYSDYMSSKEALPKAAFQYGVKMNDGRKTRRIGQKDDKQELNKQWSQIQGIIQKRKKEGDSERPAKSLKA